MLVIDDGGDFVYDVNLQTVTNTIPWFSGTILYFSSEPLCIHASEYSFTDNEIFMVYK